MSTIDITAVETETSEILAVERVAKIITGINQIGHACRLLELAGFTTKIVGQRITINNEIEARFIATNGRSWWNVFATDGTPPVWTVGATTEQGNWIGAVE